MTRIRCAGSIALSLVLAASSATAQTDTARIGQLLKNGQKITLVDDDGRELEGRVAEVSSIIRVMVSATARSSAWARWWGCR